MKVVIQRVSNASVVISDKIYSVIESGLLVLVGITDTDTEEDIAWLTRKILNIRLFADQDGIMNKSVKEVDAELLLISQFTLQASTKKGNRPSYIAAAKPQIAIPLYEKLILSLQKELEKPIKTGVFGADMKVHLVNDGPVTIIIDSKQRT